MKLLNIILIIFIALTNEIKADSKNQLFEKLQKGGNLIFIRHAYAPGNGDPDNFDIKDCSTQRNLSDTGRKQSEKSCLTSQTNKCDEQFDEPKSTTTHAFRAVRLIECN